MPNEAFSPKDLLAVVFSNLTIAGAVIYTSGWIYLRAYYDFFDIDLSVMEFGWNDTLLYSMSVLAFIVRRLWSWWSLAVVVGGAGAILLARWKWPGLDERAQHVWGSFAWRSTIVVTLTAALAALVLTMAQRAGRENAIASWKAPRLATQIVFAKDCQPAEVLKKDNANGDLLLLKSTSKLYVLFSRNSDPTSKVMDMRLYRVPAACISHAITAIRRPTQ